MENNKKNTKTVDEFGRILIPKSIRQQFGIQAGDALCYEVDADRMILRKAVAECIFCGATEEVKTYLNRPVCQNCLRTLKSQG